MTMTNTVSQEDEGVFASPSIVRRHQTVLNLRLQQFVLLTTQTEASHIRWNQPPKHKTIYQVCVKGRGFPLDISYFSSLCSSPHGAQAVHHPCQQQETFLKWTSFFSTIMKKITTGKTLRNSKIIPYPSCTLNLWLHLCLNCLLLRRRTFRQSLVFGLRNFLLP